MVRYKAPWDFNNLFNACPNHVEFDLENSESFCNRDRTLLLWSELLGQIRKCQNRGGGGGGEANVKAFDFDYSRPKPVQVLCLMTN